MSVSPKIPLSNYMFINLSTPFSWTMLRSGLKSLPKVFSSGETFRKNSVISVINSVQEQSLKESCLLVDSNDRVIGSASKRVCHRVIHGHIPLHRAFSVFLFNTRRELLLQKRSSTKITFPSCFTNTCCSHPLIDFEDETVEEGALGIKLAAIRRLNHELGVSKKEIIPEDIKYLTRIIYKSLGDGVWGEHEIDYVLFIKKDVKVEPNPEEVSEIRYVAKDNFNAFLNNLKDPITPWFQLIAQNQLSLWWENLERLDSLVDHKTIHSFNYK